jgi:hypothetical protein
MTEEDPSSASLTISQLPQGCALAEGVCGWVMPLATQAVYPGTPWVNDLAEWEGKPTVMMRNLPNKYTRALLLEELGRTGFNGTYDFLYLPVDTIQQANKGYAFINFSHPAYAKRFKDTYEDCTMPLFNSNKSITVTVAALQGFEANYAHYVNARCNKGDPSTRPLFLREFDGPVKPFSRRRPMKLAQSMRSEAQPRMPNGTKCCPSCGLAVQSSFRFCSECGYNMQS